MAGFHRAVGALGAILLCGAAAPQAATIPIPGLIHRWKLDELAGPTADDDVGTKNGTFTGANGPTPSTTNLPPLLFTNPAALTFGGTDQYLDVAGGLQDVLGGTASVAFWIHTTQASASANPWECPGVTGVEEAGGGNDIFWGFIDNTGRIGVQAGNGAAAKSLNPINNGAWHHVAVTRDGTSGQVQCFVDGALDAAATSETGAKTNAFASIGRIQDTGGGHDYFVGRLDDLRIYNRVVTLQEVQVLASGADGITPAPAAPTGVTATGGDARVDLSWAATAGATGYLVRRSTTSGGPYTTVATVLAPTTTYTDTGLTNGQTYFYVVAAFNDGGPGPNSTQVSATPMAVPRTNDHEEGLLNDRCGCGSASPPGTTGPGVLAAILGLVFFFRRRGHR